MGVSEAKVGKESESERATDPGTAGPLHLLEGDRHGSAKAAGRRDGRLSEQEKQLDREQDELKMH